MNKFYFLSIHLFCEFVFFFHLYSLLFNFCFRFHFVHTIYFFSALLLLLISQFQFLMFRNIAKSAINSKSKSMISYNCLELVFIWTRSENFIVLYLFNHICSITTYFRGSSIKHSKQKYE